MKKDNFKRCQSKALSYKEKIKRNSERLSSLKVQKVDLKYEKHQKEKSSLNYIVTPLWQIRKIFPIMQRVFNFKKKL